MTEVTSVIAYGKVNLSRASMALAALRVKPPFERDSAVNTGRRDIARNTFANSTKYPEIGGGFSSHTVSHEDGTVLLLQSQRTRNRIRVADACIFIRLRREAAKIMVRVQLPTGPESLLGDQFIAFVGNGDLLNIEELRALGYNLSNSFVDTYMAQDEIDDSYAVTEISKATAPAPSFMRIATSKGVEVRAIQAEPTRRLRIRR